MTIPLKIQSPSISAPVYQKFVVTGITTEDRIREIQGRITRENGDVIPGKTVFLIDTSEGSKNQQNTPRLFMWAIYFATKEPGIYRLDITGIDVGGKQIATDHIDALRILGPDRSARAAMLLASGIEFIYPEPNQTLDASERTYFSVFVISTRPMLSVKLWKSPGVLNKNSSFLGLDDPAENLWYATFPALDTGLNQILEAMNVDNNSESIYINV